MNFMAVRTFHLPNRVFPVPHLYGPVRPCTALYGTQVMEELRRTAPKDADAISNPRGSAGSNPAPQEDGGGSGGR
jgi:hypothetical protein